MGASRFEVEAIGWVNGGRTTPHDDSWGSVRSQIVLNSAVFEPDCALGLGDFSHIEVVFQFHLCEDDGVCRGARHPRERTDLPRIGVLAQRVKDRPNHLGVSRCELIKVDGMTLQVRGLDAIDGTPVLDIKPYFSAMAPSPREVCEPSWVAAVMKNYY